jgi:hypothetical protein
VSKESVLKRWEEWAKEFDPPPKPVKQNGEEETFDDWANRLAENRAQGLTDYFMRELEDIIPPEQHETVRKKLFKRFKEDSEKVVAKKWLEEMTAQEQE